MFKDHRTFTFGQKTQSEMSAETIELIKEIHRSVSENKSIFNQILKIDPNFAFKLYQPIKYQGINEMFIKPLVLRQIDQLMEEKQVLVKKKQVLNFTLNQVKNNKGKQPNHETNHYSFLRTTWSKFQSKGQKNCTEKIDNLNKIIGMVRSNIKNLVDNEQRSIQKELANDNIKNPFLQNLFNAKIRQEMQKLKMRNQDLEMKYLQLQQRLDQKQSKIESLEESLKQAEQKLSESMCTTRNLNQKLSALKRTRSNPEPNSKEMVDLASQELYLTFQGISEHFKIKIQASTLSQIKFQETQKSLSEIIQFLRDKSTQKLNLATDNVDVSLQIPCLSLNNTQSTNQTSLSDRYFNKSSKFIPMRTQRSCVPKNEQERIISNCEDGQQGNLTQNMQTLQTGLKRFIRKAEFPLTSDRFRKIADKRVAQEKRNFNHSIQI